MLDEDQKRRWVAMLLEAVDEIDYSDLDPIAVSKLCGIARTAPILLPAKNTSPPPKENPNE